MRPYEIVIIFDADLDEETIRSVVGRAEELVAKGGGQVGRADHWGKRRFAFELKHRWEGYFVVLQVKVEPETMAELDRVLSLSDDVLRHRLVRVPETVWGPGEAASASAET